MANVFDYKKEFGNLYAPKPLPGLVDVPKIRFLRVSGSGDPNESGGKYQKAIEALYGLCYTIKMSKMGTSAPKGYFDYIVPPLEGLWWLENDVFDMKRLMDKRQFLWLSLIRQPDFVDEDVLGWAKSELHKKKPQVDTSSVHLADWTEGLCVQCMHIGPYDAEASTLAKMDVYILEKGYADAIGDTLPDGSVRRHHEIYLGDLRKVAPEKMKTILRHPVKQK
jgi:hypothetical protein